MRDNPVTIAIAIYLIIAMGKAITCYMLCLCGIISECDSDEQTEVSEEKMVA